MIVKSHMTFESERNAVGQLAEHDAFFIGEGTRDRAQFGKLRFIVIEELLRDNEPAFAPVFLAGTSVHLSLFDERVDCVGRVRL